MSEKASEKGHESDNKSSKSKGSEKKVLTEQKLEGVVAELLGKDEEQMTLHKRLNGCTNVQGTDSLGLHVKKVFGVLVDSYPKEALEKLEEVSYLIKQKEDLSKFLRIDDSRDYKA